MLVTISAVANYTEIFTTVPFARWFLNTVYVTVMTLIGTVLSATVVAYGFSRFRFKGRDLFFFITLSTLMLPTAVRNTCASEVTSTMSTPSGAPGLVGGHLTSF